MWSINLVYKQLRIDMVSKTCSHDSQIYSFATDFGSQFNQSVSLAIKSAKCVIANAEI